MYYTVVGATGVVVFVGATTDIVIGVVFVSTVVIVFPDTSCDLISVNAFTRLSIFATVSIGVATGATGASALTSVTASVGATS